MSHPDLFALLRGELTNAEATSAGTHLAGCAECRDELAELAVGNALLTRAVRTGSGSGGTAAPLPAVPPLRPLTVRRRHPRAVALLAGAATLVVGTGLGAAGAGLAGGSDDAPAAPQAYAQVSLAPVEGSVDGGADGEVRMVEESKHHTRMTIEAPDLPGAERGHFYYAWLLDPDTNKMLPLGQIGPTGVASFDLDDALIGSYSAIDVSLEDDDGDPGHSVTSVLRGTYAVTPPAAS